MISFFCSAVAWGFYPFTWRSTAAQAPAFLGQNKLDTHSSASCYRLFE